MKYTDFALFLMLFTVGSSFASAQPAQSKPTPVPATEASAAKPAQEPTPSKACPDCAARRRDYDGVPMQTFYLKYATSAHEMNEIATALRQLLSSDDKTFVVPSENAILIRAIPEDLALAQKVLDNLDRPTKTWRLTYTITEIDDINRLGTQHYSMVAANGQEAVLKEGDRVPIATSGTVNSAMPGSTQAQFVYHEIGMSFVATLAELHEGTRLSTDVVQTSLATEKPAFTAPDPVIRQTEFKGEAVLYTGKPLVLGSMDIPGSTRRLEIEVLMEPLP